MTRTSKSLSARITPALPGVSWLRRARRVASWGAVALALCWLLWNQVEGDDRIYHAGSISAAHQFIANDCARCHQNSWQPLARFVSFDNSSTSTPDSACIACHDGARHNEHPAASMQHCSHCHREHHGQPGLAALDDRFCTSCHANLAQQGDPPFHFAETIESFAKHPEFAVFRAQPPQRDAAQLRFNHHKHLQPDDPRGLPTPARMESGGASVLAGFTKLDCAACHQLAADGAYFQPISFEQHCQQCHPLEFAENLQLGGDLPHREPAIVLDVMRSRLAQAFQRAEFPHASSASTSVDTLPGEPQTPPLTVGELPWVNERLAVAEHAVFGREAKGGCRYCHTVEQSATGYKIAPTAIPERWQEHARFQHASHRLLDCAACHDKTLASQSTADILLPKIASCRACHGPESDKSGQASDACVECHDFHDHGLDKTVGVLGLDLKPMEPRRRGGAEGGERDDEGARKEGARE